ncbi:hypothetical protein CW676_03335 [Macrococcoides caseolyticum]|uniref:hypothetical protein n=2 Tax=Macrococcoides caseolyticum TaxID=69966 RepID=UPI000C34DCC5|nr:hypothetical protein [Macrococcus caseolyticus]PKE07207.1 hypothetical protein CW692_04170 [Macrococcus caseolyticus]PKE24645.1 hypothetical protein CW689_02885 [Macrococcus caseolyticus]PKE53908.1 hypothetical protein CW676_03335 [Macrococcus caseolyticus]PKF39030.1 hypothetical protein CW681_03665 [Macrococcus caseolyticus]TDM30353.1 hypothetical protein ETH98_02730 [Macrococcus caseolyticus]
MEKLSRKEYQKEYRRKNAERMKELNRINYLKRKEKSKHIKQDDTILKVLEANKQERILSMSIHRKRRRRRVQEAIHHELSMC